MALSARRWRMIPLALLLAGGAEAADLHWGRITPLPDGASYDGAFVTTVGGKLVVAGGTRAQPAPGTPPTAVRDCWILDTPGGSWSKCTPLPEALAHGAAASFDGSAVLAGGVPRPDGPSSASAYMARLDGQEIAYEALPPMPQRRAHGLGAALDGTFYLVGGSGGTEEPVPTFALDLQSEDIAWTSIPGLPGETIALAAQDGALFAFRDSETHRFDPGSAWRRVRDAPTAITIPAAVAIGPTHVAVLASARSDAAWSYHTVTDTWTRLGSVPSELTAASALGWNGRIVAMPGGTAPAMAAELVSDPSRFSSLDYAALAAYFAVLVAMGIYFSSKGSSTEEFFLAGRRMPWWATGLSIFGTQLSSISFMAVPAKVYATDWVYFLLQMTIVMVAFPVVYLYLPYFRRAKMTSAYEYLETRFNLPARIYASVSFVLYQVGRMAIVLFLPAIALSTVTGISVYACILAMGVLSTLYTVMGGIRAVIWTDVVQVFVLYGGALLSLVILLAGTDGGLQGIVSDGLEHDKFHMFNWSWDWTTTAVWVVVVGNLFLNLVPYTSDQAVVQRYFTTKDEKAAARSIWTNAALIIPSTLTLFLLGTGLWAFYRQNPELLDPALPTDSIFPLFIAQQLPAGIAGLLIAAIFAASMSTLDSSLNSVSAALVTDFYARFRSASTDRSRLILARFLTAALGALATLTSVALATFDIGSLWDTFQGMMGLLGGGLAGLFALGIFFPRASGGGAVTGAAASVLILYWVQQQTDLHFFLYGAVGILSCVGIGLLASPLFPNRASQRA